MDEQHDELQVSFADKYNKIKYQISLLVPILAWIIRIFLKSTGIIILYHNGAHIILRLNFGKDGFSA